MGQQTTAIAERVVYAQPSEPNDERDGVLWVDTSVSPRETFVYSTDSGSWEAVATKNYNLLEDGPNRGKQIITGTLSSSANFGNVYIDQGDGTATDIQITLSPSGGDTEIETRYEYRGTQENSDVGRVNDGTTATRVYASRVDRIQIEDNFSNGADVSYEIEAWLS